jgi:hypothetical protein
MTIDPTALRSYVYDTIFARGLPPKLAQIATRFGTSVSSARRSIAGINIGKTILAHPVTGEIWMAGPFAAEPTDHVVRGARTTWFANCAWDMLGVAALVKEPVSAYAKCTDCGEPMSMSVDPDRGVVDPVGVVHFLLPAREWYRDIGFT